MRAPLGLITLLATAACGEEGARDGETCAGSGKLLVSLPPDQQGPCVEFGDVVVGYGFIERVQVANDSPRQQWLRVEVAGPFRLRSQRAAAPPCSTTTVDILCLPSMPGPAEGTITLTCDGCEPVTLCLRATGVPP